MWDSIKPPAIYLFETQTHCSIKLLYIKKIFFSLALPIHSAADFLATKDPNTEEEQEENTPIYEKFDALLHGSKSKL